jgi:thiopeptide-type bacteriocin biosynthesis protein
MRDRGRLTEATYQPETERFGGYAGMHLAEEYFHITSRVALDRLAQPVYTYGDSLYDGMRLHAMSAYAAQMDASKAAWYFGRLCEQWAGLFYEPVDKADTTHMLEDLKAGFKQKLAPQLDDLRYAMQELWSTIGKDYFDHSQPEWLRWMRGNQLIMREFGDNLDKVLPSLLHLTNNRMGINNQDEVYLCYILQQTLSPV